MSLMSIPLNPLQKGLILAFSRLQVWFDPAQAGSPYETPHMGKTKNGKRQSPFFSKRLSMRI